MFRSMKYSYPIIQLICTYIATYIVTACKKIQNNNYIHNDNFNLNFSMTLISDSCRFHVSKSCMESFAKSYMEGFLKE